MTRTTTAPLLGFWMCVALVVGNTIASGVFLLPASLAPYGLNSLVAWGFTSAGALLLAVVFASLSRSYPHAGGPYGYVKDAFGPFTAFLMAWGYWISVWVGNVAIATGGVSYLTPLMPWVAHVPGASAGVTLAVLWALTFVNCYGVKESGRVQSVTTILKLMPLIAIAVLGFFAVRSSTLKAAAGGIPLTGGATTAAATQTLWALLGLESASIPASKVEDPGRNIPRATLIGTAVTALICVVACTTVVLLVPPAQLAASNAPFVDVANQYWGAGIGRVVAVFAAISAFGALNGWILLHGEIPNQLAKNGVFPRVFARDSQRLTPVFSLVFTSGLVSIFVLMFYKESMVKVFTFMTLLSTIACLVLYALCSAALLRLYWREDAAARVRRRYAILVVALLAGLYSLWAIAGAGTETMVWGAALLALGAPVYWFSAKRRTA